MTKPYRSSLFIPIIVLGLLIVFIAIMLVSSGFSAKAAAPEPNVSNNATLQFVDINAQGLVVSMSQPIPYSTFQYVNGPPATLIVKRYADRLFANGFDQE